LVDGRKSKASRYLFAADRYEGTFYDLQVRYSFPSLGMNGNILILFDILHYTNRIWTVNYFDIHTRSHRFSLPLPSPPAASLLFILFAYILVFDCCCCCCYEIVLHFQVSHNQSGLHLCNFKAFNCNVCCCYCMSAPFSLRSFKDPRSSPE